MGSTYKFESGLNNWVDSDKPVRQDFVNDNEILTDNAMWMEHYDSAGDPANPTHPVREAGGIPAYAMAKANYDASGAVAAAGGIMPVVNNAIASKDGFTTYTHSKTGSVHSLSSTASGKNIKFKVATGGGFVEGDTFKVNGTARTAKLENGEPLPDAAFAAGATVSCILGDDNVLNFKSGGGLTIKVISVASEADLPVTAKDGTVALVAPSVAMVGKPYYGTEAPADTWVGRVWLPLTDGMPYCLISTTDIYITAKAPRIYAESEWITPTSQIRQNGAWVSFENWMWVYKNGTLVMTLEVSKQSNAVVTYEATRIAKTVNSTTNRGCAIYTRDAIDIAPQKRLMVDAKIDDLQSSVPRIGIAKNKSGGVSPNYQKSRVMASAAAPRQVYTLELDDVAISGYVCVDGSWEGHIYRMWLE